MVKTASCNNKDANSIEQTCQISSDPHHLVVKFMHKRLDSSSPFDSGISRDGKFSTMSRGQTVFGDDPMPMSVDNALVLYSRLALRLMWRWL